MPRRKVRSKTLVAARAELLKRQRAVGAERDQLRALAAECAELADSCEEAHDAIENAIEILSRYA